jgi:hypothetical protein
MRAFSSFLIVLLFTSIASIASAHEDAEEEALDVIDTDRPHQTDTPHVVPTGHVQVESAIVSVPTGNVNAPAGTSVPAHLVLFENNYKFGLAPHFDLQLLFKHADFVPEDHKLAAPGPLGVRAKLNVVQEHGWVPAITLVPWIFVPFDRDQILHGGPLVFWGWELPLRLELEVNAGVLFYARGPRTVAPVIASALTHTVVEPFRVFVDVYATGPDVSLGTGALWAFTRDAQIDAGTYVGLHGDVSKATPFIGLSVRK